MKEYKRAVLFVNGDATPGFSVSIKPSDWLVAVDGGLRHIFAQNRMPDVLIGDLDSVNPQQLAACEAAQVEILRFPPVKDKTDLELGLDLAIERGFKHIVIAYGPVHLEYTVIVTGREEVDTPIVHPYGSRSCPCKFTHPVINPDWLSCPALMNVMSQGIRDPGDGSHCLAVDDKYAEVPVIRHVFLEVIGWSSELLRRIHKGDPISIEPVHGLCNHLSEPGDEVCSRLP